jgi:hypothetical protein
MWDGRSLYTNRLVDSSPLPTPSLDSDSLHPDLLADTHGGPHPMAAGSEAMCFVTRRSIVGMMARFSVHGGVVPPLESSRMPVLRPGPRPGPRPFYSSCDVPGLKLFIWDGTEKSATPLRSFPAPV